MPISYYGEICVYAQPTLSTIRCEFSNGDKNTSVKRDASMSDIPLCYNSPILN
jgi:hypothetical protein